MDVGLTLFAVEEAIGHFRGEIARCNCVDPNVIARQLQRQRLGQLHHAGLGRAVVAIAGTHPQAKHRCDVDDAARAFGACQALCRTLGHAPDTVEVG
ncbi:hypothetical protein D3C81_1891710 [compost metagenome]